MRSTKFWIILISGILAISLIAAAAVYFWHGTGTIACVYQDGVLIREIPLETVTAPYSFDVTWENGKKNTITVEPGRICISEAQCPDQICVHTGWISDGITPIVCLPNHLSIRIESDLRQADGVVR